METNHQSRFAVVIVAAGKSTRFGGKTSLKKPFAHLAGKPVWQYSMERFALRDDVGQLIIVVAPEDRQWFLEYYADEINRFMPLVVAGGAERVDSVAHALVALEENIDFVAVHDAARPCVSDKQIDEVFKKAEDSGAAILATPVVATIKRAQDGKILQTVPRADLWEAQTPQVFRREMLRRAFEARDGSVPTDDAELVEKIGYTVSIVPADRRNIKITTQADLQLAETILFPESK